MKKILALILFSIFLFSLASAASINSNEVKVHYFYSPTCSHCKNVADSGVLEKVNASDNITVIKYNVFEPGSQQRFIDLSEKVSAPQAVPLAVIEIDGKYSYLSGDSEIIGKLEEAATGKFIGAGFFDKIKFSLETKFNQNVVNGKLTFAGVSILMLIALIDAINPCAFGVLIFLMAGLLSMGSSKRALKAGLVYSAVIFITYFLAGLIIVKTLASFSSVINPVLLIAGILIFIGSLIEIKDFFWYGKGFSLKIPDSVKPRIEQLIHKGTLPAILILGILVALVELPCTGGVYLAILGLMSANQVSGLGSRMPVA